MKKAEAARYLLMSERRVESLLEMGHLPSLDRPVVQRFRKLLRAQQRIELRKAAERMSIAPCAIFPSEAAAAAVRSAEAHS